MKFKRRKQFRYFDHQLLENHGSSLYSDGGAAQLTNVTMDPPPPYYSSEHTMTMKDPKEVTESDKL